MELSLFDSDLFVSFKEETKKALQEVEGNDPTKATLDTVLPGVHRQFSNLHNEITRVYEWHLRIGRIWVILGEYPVSRRRCVDMFVQVSNLFSSFLLVQRPK
jgi:hypothetical protein